jgi:hypothetical protein
MLTETNFAPLLPATASAELSKQIEALEPSANLLNAAGFNWLTAAELAKQIKNGPDLAELRHCGIVQASAVDICTKIAARHKRKAAAIPPAPQPAPVKPAPVKPAAPELDGFCAASMMHTLFSQTEGSRAACLTTLIRDGWSESTAKELVKISSAASRAFPKVVRL